MDFSLSSEEETFRQEVRDFLEEHLPPRQERAKDYVKKVWLPKVREKRWVGFSWPKAVGGGGGTVMQQAILKEEMTRAQAPALGTSWMGLQWVGPGLIAYGTEDQQRNSDMVKIVLCKIRRPKTESQGCDRQQQE